jgi:putative phosphoesterase
MQVAVISDIHSNFAALDRVLMEIEKQKIKTIYCLGDMIGYGNEPEEVIQALRLRNAICIAGNHEMMLLKGEDRKGMNLSKTKTQLSSESLQFIAHLPRERILEEFDVILSHALPYTDDAYLYANSNFSVLDDIPHHTIFMGHSHYPMLMSYYDKKIINPGSVGQPRDGQEKSSYLICDFNFDRCTFHRVG